MIMPDCGRMSVRSLLIVGLVVVAVLPGWSRSQQTTEPNKPAQVADSPFQIAEGEIQVEVVADPAKPSAEKDRLDLLEQQLDRILKEVKALRSGKKTTAEGATKAGEQPKNVIIKARVSPQDQPKAKNAEKSKPVVAPQGTYFEPTTTIGNDGKVTTDYVIKQVEKTKPVVVPQGAYYQPRTTVGKDGRATTAYVIGNLSEDANAVVLTRATYKMPKEKAEGLAKFLGENVKGQVLESKVEADSIIVTTTPENQRVIGQFIALVLGKVGHERFQIHLNGLNYESVPAKIQGEVTIPAGK